MEINSTCVQSDVVNRVQEVAANSKRRLANCCSVSRNGGARFEHTGSPSLKEHLLPPNQCWPAGSDAE